MLSLLYQDSYDVLEKLSKAIDFAIATKDIAVDKVHALHKQVKTLNAKFADFKAAQENAVIKEKELINKLAVFEAAKNEAVPERDSLSKETNKILDELSVAQAKIENLNKAFTKKSVGSVQLDTRSEEKKAKIVDLKSPLKEAKRNLNVDLLEASMNLVTLIWKADTDRDFSFLPKEYPTEVERLQCKALESMFAYPTDSRHEADEPNDESSESDEDDEENDPEGEQDKTLVDPNSVLEADHTTEAAIPLAE